ncbi:MAG: hypothetical protein ABS918_02215, partial [Saccharopolyspora rectivirgula]
FCDLAILAGGEARTARTWWRNIPLRFSEVLFVAEKLSTAGSCAALCVLAEQGVAGFVLINYRIRGPRGRCVRGVRHNGYRQVAVVRQPYSSIPG